MAFPSRFLIRALTKGMYLGVWRIGTKHEYGGVKVRTWLSGEEAAAASANVEAALSLIHSTAPKSHANLRSDFRGILLWDLQGPHGQWRNDVKICMLDETYVQQTDVERLAMTIVHEATHAKLFRNGVGYPEALRQRIEGVCFRASAAFARRLAKSSELQAEVSRSVHRSEEYWSDGQFTARKLSRMEKLGAPRWLMRFLRWRVSRRSRSPRDA